MREFVTNLPKTTIPRITNQCWRVREQGYWIQVSQGSKVAESAVIAIARKQVVAMILPLPPFDRQRASSKNSNQF
jgi:hypothetical protein